MLLGRAKETKGETALAEVTLPASRTAFMPLTTQAELGMSAVCLKQVEILTF